MTDAKHEKNLTATESTGVKCEIDGVWVHSIPAYLAVVHPHLTPDAYLERYMGAELYSPLFKEAKAKKESLKMEAATVTKLPTAAFGAVSKKAFSEVFELGTAKAAMNKRGEPILIDVLGATDPDLALDHFIPAIDPNYIYNIDLLKTVMMAAQLNKPMLLWGYHGTGKTSLVEQFCARTNRPFMRVQHTVSTEEAHVLGQYVVRDGATHFQPGPLAIAMKYGMVYCADEYDFALPSVTSVYQPVLEGKPLIIKEACPEWQFVKPHPQFRFYATGNTNGGGDESGLYQGTQMQNAANYSRFGITAQVDYMPEKQEIAVVASQGGIHKDDSAKLVDFGKKVRDAFIRQEIGVTVSPRELINAAQLGRVLGGEWKQGLQLAYTNRLNSVDRKAVDDVIQRIFGA